MHGSGTASLTWWGTLAFMLIEGMGFALAIGSYLYLVSVAAEWPPGGVPPDPLWGTAVTAVFVISIVPNLLLSRWAGEEDLRKVRIGIVLMSVLGLVPLALRVFEFSALNMSWDSNAYGSITWLLLGLHTTHLVTDVADTFVLAAVMFTRHGDNKRRYGDVQDNALYWNFVTLTWLPVYACLYGIPRL
ncbi:cytochrome c oxidase subunit 3 [Roseomonas sp. SSH11]|uniref:Cytochrome c oxidase subunit 3 n=1 Tax=Pararoseomonas baculiformis TaxID=2820812 RepID=A0ABS4AGQ7_9PROT|nr:cytochrome c oxidase subunit 3 [Pararoseomonas baculiformis]